MEDFLLYLFYFIVGLLHVILFFKIWGMTNDVDKLKERFCTPYFSGVKKKFTEYYLCGEYEEAYKFLNHYLVSEMHERFYTQSRNGNSYKKEFEDWFAKLIDRFSKYYRLIGKDVPDNLKNVTFDSYDNMVYG